MVLHFEGVRRHFKGVPPHFKGVRRHFKGVRPHFKGVPPHFKGQVLRFVLFAAPYTAPIALVAPPHVLNPDFYRTLSELKLFESLLFEKGQFL